MAARNGEQLILQRHIRPTREQQFYGGQSNHEQIVLGGPIERVKGPEQGVFGGKINYEETVAIARELTMRNLQPSDVIVKRVDRRGHEKGISQEQVHRRLERYQRNPLKAEAGERFRIAKAEETEDRKNQFKFPHFAWPLLLSRMIVGPIRALQLREKGLLSEKPSWDVLNRIEDDFAGAIRTHTPELADDLTGIGNGFLRIMRTPIVSYGTSLLSAIPGLHFTDSILDGMQGAADYDNGEGYQRATQDALVTGIDLIPFTVFFNLGIVQNALGWYNNIVRRGSINLVREALTDETSPYYKQREVLAQRVLRANIVETNMDGALRHTEALNSNLVENRMANHNDQLAHESLIVSDWKMRRYLRTGSNLRWQKNLAAVIDLAKSVVPNFNPLEAQQTNSLSQLTPQQRKRINR